LLRSLSKRVDLIQARGHCWGYEILSAIII